MQRASKGVFWVVVVCVYNATIATLSEFGEIAAVQCQGKTCVSEEGVAVYVTGRILIPGLSVSAAGIENIAGE